MERVYVVIKVQNGEYCGIEGIFKSERDTENRAVSLKLMYQDTQKMKDKTIKNVCMKMSVTGWLRATMWNKVINVI